MKQESHLTGWQKIHVTNAEHPYMKNWWVPGCTIGYEHTFINQVADFFGGIERGLRCNPTSAVRCTHQKSAMRCCGSPSRSSGSGNGLESAWIFVELVRVAEFRGEQLTRRRVERGPAVERSNVARRFGERRFTRPACLIHVVEERSLSIEFQQTIPLLRIFDAAKSSEFYIDYLGFTLDWEHRFDVTAFIFTSVARLAGVASQ